KERRPRSLTARDRTSGRARQSTRGTASRRTRQHPAAAARGACMIQQMLQLDDIQGDVVIGMQKDVENFIFFKIADKTAFRGLLKRHVVGRITSAQQVQQRDSAIGCRKKLGYTTRDRLLGLNLGFTSRGMTQLLGRD